MKYKVGDKTLLGEIDGCGKRANSLGDKNWAVQPEANGEENGRITICNISHCPYTKGFELSALFDG